MLELPSCFTAYPPDSLGNRDCWHWIVNLLTVITLMAQQNLLWEMNSQRTVLFLLEPHYLTFYLPFLFLYFCATHHMSPPLQYRRFFIGHDECITAGTYLCPNSFIETLVSVSVQVLTNCHYSMRWLKFRKFNVLPWYQMILAGLFFTKKFTGFTFGFHAKHLLFRV